MLIINQKDTSKIEIPNFVKFNTSNDGEKSFTGFLINNTKSTKNIFTQDNSLLMIMEAKDSIGKWIPIEFWMWSDCGNSYFNPLKLEKGKFVTFKIPIYRGGIKTKMRLKLFGQDKFIYSDEFDGRLTEK